ncbi:hypothetical protein TcCL_NonESM07011 [Trypanosoma cruzi]|nr:hypothetical protein TcCL_NonESM07011 [Trypanosoma cruzi]
MGDGIPRLANTLPRRKEATFALRKADWPASTSCEALLATAPTWLYIRRGILRAAERHIPRGSRDSPKNDVDTRNGTSRDRRRSCIQSTHCLTWRQSTSSRIYLKKRGLKSGLTPWLRYASGSPRSKNLGPHPAQAGDISAAWRRRTLILRNRLCSALNLAAFPLCLGNRQICSSIILCGFTCHITLCCCCCTPHSIASW